jgi:hypothetical protein
MKITIESTSKLVELQLRPGVVALARIWEGTTEHGTPVHCFITRVCPTIPTPDLPKAVVEEFEASLRETRAPSALVEAIPMRMIL